MLDSLVRVTRRVGQAADADTADAGMPNASSVISSKSIIERFHQYLRAGKRETTNYPLLERAQFTPAYITRTLGRMIQRLYTLRLVTSPFLGGLDLNQIASLAVRTGRGAYHREMRRTSLIKNDTSVGLNVPIYLRRKHLQENERLIPRGS